MATATATAPRTRKPRTPRTPTQPQQPPIQPVQHALDLPPVVEHDGVTTHLLAYTPDPAEVRVDAESAAPELWPWMPDDSERTQWLITAGFTRYAISISVTHTQHQWRGMPIRQLLPYRVYVWARRKGEAQGYVGTALTYALEEDVITDLGIDQASDQAYHLGDVYASHPNAPYNGQAHVWATPLFV